jgi:putative cell wall-binding protein
VRLSAPVALRGSITGRDVQFAPTNGDIQVTATSGDAELDAWLPGRIGTTEVPGKYLLQLLPGTYDLSFIDTTGAHHTLVVPDVVVTPEGTTRDVVLEAARSSIEGTVSLRTASGVAPVDHVFTRLYVWSATTKEWVVSTERCGWSDDQFFFVDCLGAGRYKLAVMYSNVETFWGGGDLESAPVIELAEGESRSGVDIIVDDPASFSGVMAVRASDGSIVPVGLSRVAVWRKTAAGDFEPHPISEYGHRLDELVASARGEFHGWLRPGTYVFKFWDRSPYTGATYSGGARFLEDATEVTLGFGEQRDLGTIVLPESSFTVERIAGADRFATAVAVSQRVVPTGQRAPVVYLTNAYDFPDALGAGPAAMRAGGVILPVSQESVPPVVAAELRRIRPERVVIAGGRSVVSDAVRDDVREMVPADTDLVRLGGTSRYETADLIVRDAFSAEGSRHAIIATGRTYPDALAAGPAAGHLDAPVLLVDGQRGLQAATKATIQALGITDVHIVGGTGAVGTSLESGLRALLGDAHVTRLAGVDRIFTAIEVNEEIFGATDTGYLATAGGFADALAGGPLAAMEGAPLYLSSPGCLNYWALEGLRYRQIARLTLLGGTGVLSSGVAKLTTCP